MAVLEKNPPPRRHFVRSQPRNSPWRRRVKSRVVVETKQLVLSQFKTFYRSHLKIKYEYDTMLQRAVKKRRVAAA